METETDVRTYYLANVCHVCKAKNPNVRCEICNMIFYCTPEHRRENWYDHSELCRVIYKLKVAENLQHLYEKAVNADSERFREMKHSTAIKCTKILGRPLKPWEYELLYHPALCSLCYEYDWKVLRPCEGCGYAMTCPKNHFQKNHQKWCQKLKTYTDVIIHQKNIKGWAIKNEQPPRMAASMKEFVAQLAPQEQKTENHTEVREAILSETLTYPLTVLRALKILKKNLENNSKLTIYFVGAETQAEVEPRGKWENFLLHYLDDIKTINLVFIGPELKLAADKATSVCLEVCKNCRSQQRQVILDFMPGKFYHDFVENHKETRKPDLICALNSGMYRQNGFVNQDSWKETIRELFANGQPPVLITEYTSHELQEDLKSIRKQSSKLLLHLEPSINPFASLKPGLNILSEQESPVIFKNYYSTILSSES